MSSFHIWVFSEVKDPVPLWHFGKKEVLAKIGLMEDQYDIPMIFDESHVPPAPFVPGQDISSWGEGVVQCSQRPQEGTPNSVTDG